MKPGDPPKYRLPGSSKDMLSTGASVIVVLVGMSMANRRKGVENVLWDSEGGHLDICLGSTGSPITL